MFGDAFGEGVNGNYYSEELDFSGEYDSVRTKRKTPFIPDPYFYFRKLFGDNEKHIVVYETRKAVLFEADKGKFWVPKALLRRNKTLVHRSFSRSYLRE